MDELMDLIDDYVDCRIKYNNSDECYYDSGLADSTDLLKQGLKDFVFDCIKEYEEKIGCV